MPRICVIGSANVDHNLALPRLPHPGETVSGGTLLTNLGGKGANQAVAARKLGAEVRMLGAVGEDGPGRESRERLDAAGIDVTGIVPVPDAATGTALIFVDAEGRNQIGVAPGANHRLTVEMLRPYEGAIAWADVVVCQLETPLPVVRWALEEAHRHGVRAILNPAPVRELPDDLLGLVAYLTPNEGEAAALAGREGVVEAEGEDVGLVGGVEGFLSQVVVLADDAAVGIGKACAVGEVLGEGVGGDGAVGDLRDGPDARRVLRHSALEPGGGPRARARRGRRPAGPRRSMSCEPARGGRVRAGTMR